MAVTVLAIGEWNDEMMKAVAAAAEPSRCVPHQSPTTNLHWTHVCPSRHTHT